MVRFSLVYGNIIEDSGSSCSDVITVNKVGVAAMHSKYRVPRPLFVAERNALIRVSCCSNFAV